MYVVYLYKDVAAVKENKSFNNVYLEKFLSFLGSMYLSRMHMYTLYPSVNLTPLCNPIYLVHQSDYTSM